MANCLDYAKIAMAAYYNGPNQYCWNPPGNLVDDWTVQHWEKGTLFGNGYQGGIWTSDSDVVVGCCGTNTKQKGKFFQDIIADIKIALKMMPSQARSAIKMVKLAKTIAGRRPVSVCGHSLGGGLAQVCGVYCNVPFVTFNAPAMKAIILESKMTGLSLLPGSSIIATILANAGFARNYAGVNFRIEGDLVSSHFKGIAGDHVGMIVDLEKGMEGGSHGKNQCWQAILETDWAFINPFG
ncbi:MAG TPA: YqiA/YcfP family alpha/beta fold hydrolase [Gemmata sp.]|jgi:putative lipase involved disintegration of autophagic bodies|nr:YqiA/YcfP family alpha/beta fold hydrolase [Gemmata sp.]